MRLRPFPDHSRSVAPNPQRTNNTSAGRPIGSARPGYLEVARMEKVPMTPEGHKRLEDELRRLKSENRPAAIRAID